MTNNGVKEAKFMYNGIKVDGTLYKGWYSMSGNGGRMEGSIVIYARDYKSFPKIEGLTIKNDSDCMTDYFEEDQICVSPDNVHYVNVKAAYDKQEAKRKARQRIAV